AKAKGQNLDSGNMLHTLFFFSNFCFLAVRKSFIYKDLYSI
ncbi:MAG: hypothetical protein ACI956_002404, partial [Nonlabens sp.]